MGDNQDQGIERNGPAYRPRDFCLRKDHFGRHDQAEFRQPLSEAEAVLIDAARMLHDIAHQACLRSSTKDAPRSGWRDEWDTSISRLGQLLRGEVPMRLVDVAAPARTLALTLL